MNITEWKALSGKEQTLWLEANAPISGLGKPRGKVHGVGVNDAIYVVNLKIGGKRIACPAYLAWERALKRAYSPAFHENSRTYIGVEVCEGWHSFSTFRVWWLDNQIDGWQLDKDLLTGSREYSPESCLFVPRWLNNFTTGSAAKRGEWPIGVSWYEQGNKFQSKCCNPFGKRDHLGYFPTAEDAHQAWRARKLELAQEYKAQMDEIDDRIYARVIQIINDAK